MSYTMAKHTGSRMTLLTLLVLSTIFDTSGLVAVKVEVLKFSNPRSLRGDGLCCEDDCRSSCDHKLLICLDAVKENEDRDITHCSIVTHTTDVFLGRDVIDFGNTLTVKGQLHTWKGKFVMKVNVFDADLDKSDWVDYYYSELDQSASKKAAQSTVMTIRGTRKAHPTSLTFKFTVQCSTHFYGDQCDLYCPDNVNTTGDTLCDRRKLCIASENCQGGESGELSKNPDQDPPGRGCGAECQNGGTCLQGLCVCELCYRGVRCQQRICDPDPGRHTGMNCTGKRDCRHVASLSSLNYTTVGVQPIAWRGVWSVALSTLILTILIIVLIGIVVIKRNRRNFKLVSWTSRAPPGCQQIMLPGDGMTGSQHTQATIVSMENIPDIYQSIPLQNEAGSIGNLSSRASVSRHCLGDSAEQGRSNTTPKSIY